jgi:hypothetical protein
VRKTPPGVLRTFDVPSAARAANGDPSVFDRRRPKLPLWVLGIFDSLPAALDRSTANLPLCCSTASLLRSLPAPADSAVLLSCLPTLANSRPRTIAFFWPHAMDAFGDGRSRIED